MSPVFRSFLLSVPEAPSNLPATTVPSAANSLGASWRL